MELYLNTWSDIPEIIGPSFKRRKHFFMFLN